MFVDRACVIFYLPCLNKRTENLSSIMACEGKQKHIKKMRLVKTHAITNVSEEKTKKMKTFKSRSDKRETQ